VFCVVSQVVLVLLYHVAAMPSLNVCCRDEEAPLSGALGVLETRAPDLVALLYDL
jgi:hypothetical protein